MNVLKTLGISLAGAVVTVVGFAALFVAGNAVFFALWSALSWLLHLV